MREQVIERIRAKKIITIVRGVYGEQVAHLAEALAAGGIELMEVTFDQSDTAAHAQTAAAIHAIKAHMGERMLVGAGTVTTPSLVEMAKEAGAEYIVSPDLRPAVIERTRELGMVSLPGALTPTEINNAYDAGADFVKVFPAAQLGPAYIKAGCCGAGVGGNLVNKQWIAAGEWDRITALAKEFVEAVCERG